MRLTRDLAVSFPGISATSKINYKIRISQEIMAEQSIPGETAKRTFAVVFGAMAQTKHEIEIV